jgi:hypothetical protein
MSRYAWPPSPRRDTEDHPAERGRFVRRTRREFDPDGAREAGRKALVPAPVPSRRGLVAKAPPVGADPFLWQPLGPVNVTGGQTIGAARVAGRINMLAVHKDGDRLYAASGNGGVWFSADGGSNWVSLGGFATTPVAGIKRPAQRNACGAIEVAFGATAADDVAYLGTGETTHSFSGQPGRSEAGVGIMVAQHPATAGVDDPWVREAKNLVNEGVCRIALQPGGNGVVAATTTGLFQRPAGGGLDCDWTKLPETPFNTLADKCSDVLWTKGEAGTRPERLWVWVQEGTQPGLWCRDAGAGVFKRIVPMALFADGSGPRGQLARVPADVSPAQFYAICDTGGVNAPQLIRVKCPGNGVPTFELVTAGVPSIMAGQGFYDIVVATHPSQPDRVVIGGSTFAATAPDGTAMLASGNTNDAAVLIGDVAMNAGALTFGSPNPPAMVGINVHADVHDIVWTNGGNRLWVACDGGVFRSDKPTVAVSFYAVNNGLAVIESNYIACHPVCEGFVVAGLQDNGVITRRSNSHWKHDGDGDGGGVALDPLNPGRYFRQYFRGGWETVPAPGGLPVTQAENDTAAFYSEAAAIAAQRGAVKLSQLIVGTRRVWYSEDFGSTWFTLPSGSTSAVANATIGLDAFGQVIRVCRWQTPDVAWVLGETKLMRYARTANASAPGTWTATEVRPVDVVPGGKEKKRPPVPPSMNDATMWTDIGINLDGPGIVRGTLGALYLGTTGHETKPEVDTLWWFDGTDKWIPTGLRTDPKGVPAPVVAIACHADFPLDVWVGTTVGVWHGARADNGANPPTWAWNGRVNGLPEAAVEDLQIFKDGTLVLLRAGIAARGVWELRLDQPLVVPRTYLRAHDDDLRYRDTAVSKKRDLVTDRSWHGSPDVRPRRAAVSLANPASLPWFRGSPAVDEEMLRRFQSALRASRNDPRVQPTGRWDAYFNEVLRDLGAAIAPAPPPLPAPQVPPAGAVLIDNALWNGAMAVPANATAEPWGAGVPSEADLADFALKLEEGDATQASCALARAPHKVDVVVHHRGGFAVGGATVRVTLLKWVDPAASGAAQWNDASTWFSADLPWFDAVNQVLNSADGKTAIALTAGWSFVLGAAGDSHRVDLTGQMVNNVQPGMASFDLDLATATPDSLVLLVAVIRVGSDITLAGNLKLRDLALTSPNVAVRSVHVKL